MGVLQRGRTSKLAYVCIPFMITIEIRTHTNLQYTSAYLDQSKSSAEI